MRNIVITFLQLSILLDDVNLFESNKCTEILTNSWYSLLVFILDIYIWSLAFIDYYSAFKECDDYFTLRECENSGVFLMMIHFIHVLNVVYYFVFGKDTSGGMFF